MALRLILQQGGQQLAVDLRDGTYTIGRDDRAEVVVPNTTVSGRHAELRVTGTGAMIRDLGSSNGTFVNGTRLGGAATALSPGDDLILGSARITVTSPGASAPAVIDTTSRIPAGPDAPSASAAAPAAAKFSWATSLWLAGATAIAIVVVLLLLAEAYAQRHTRRAMLASRYLALASQYTHVLRSNQAGPVPDPVYDHWLAPPVMVVNATGRIIYPAPIPGEQPRLSPLVDPKSGRIPDQAKVGLYRIALPSNEGSARASSAPVLYGGELFGFVIAGEGRTPSNLPLVALMVLCSALIALLLLYVFLRPIINRIRRDLETLTEKLTPFTHGIIDALPRGHRMPEVDALAAEIESLVAAKNNVQARIADAHGGSEQSYMIHFAELVDAAKLPYCFISSDFNLLAHNRAFSAIQEVGGVKRGVSIFETGMNNMQSKQLIRAINDARTQGEGLASVDFTHTGALRNYQVTVRKFTEPSSGGHIFGLLFNSPAA